MGRSGRPLKLHRRRDEGVVVPAAVMAEAQPPPPAVIGTAIDRVQGLSALAAAAAAVESLSQRHHTSTTTSINSLSPYDKAMTRSDHEDNTTPTTTPVMKMMRPLDLPEVWAVQAAIESCQLAFLDMGRNGDIDEERAFCLL